MIMLSIEQCYNFADICLYKVLKLCSIKLALGVHQVYNMLHTLHTLYILLFNSLLSLVFVILVLIVEKHFHRCPSLLYT